MNSEGVLRWKYSNNNIWSFEQDPTIDWEGNVYFISDTLFSFTNNGEIRWKVPMKSYVWNALICDSGNRIYTFKNDASDGFNGYCINMSGEIIWQMSNTGERTRLGKSSVIFNDSILFPGWRSEWIYVIQ